MTVLDELLRQTEALLAERAGRPAIGHVSGDTRLHDLDVDSMDLAVLLAHFEQTYDVTLENEDIRPSEYATLADVAGRVSQRLAQHRL